jgi:hypothetical protein
MPEGRTRGCVPRRAAPTLVRNDRFTDTWRRPRGVVGGSREHFFHFLVGYLLPVTHVVRVRGLRRFRVLDCGPLMTPLLVGTLERLGLAFEVSPNHRVRRSMAVPAWDHGWDDVGAVHRAVAQIRAAWSQDPECSERDCPRSANLLIMRSAPDPYYEPGGGTERPGYGVARRSITNLREVSTALIGAGIEHDLYEPGRHSLGCQIASFGRADVLVGIRGAEWANLVWSSPAVRALILDPDPPARTLQRFVDRLGLRCDILEVAEPHIAIDPRSVIDFLVKD